MSKDSICEKLEKCFKKIEENDTDNRKFAYWALTSKLEIPFRDYFSYCLHEEYNRNQNMKIISREYGLGNRQRADIMILDTNGVEEILIEFKACFTLNFEEYDKKEKNSKNKKSRYVCKVESDFVNRSTVKNVSKENKYFVLLAVNPLKSIPNVNIKENEFYNRIIPNSTKINNFIGKGIDVEKLEKEFRYAKLTMVDHNHILLNDSFIKDLECELWWFVLKSV